MHVAITGANRGLGLAFARAWLARGATVYAGCRNPASAEALHALAEAHGTRLHVLPLSLPDAASIAGFCAAIGERTGRLDRLVNNAGVLAGGERFGSLDAETMARSYATNAIGPVLLTQALVDLLERGTSPRVVNLSSRLGAIALVDRFTSPSYNASKAALNMWTRLLAQALNPRGVRCFAISPGWVRTDMGGAQAQLAPEESVAAMIETIEAAGDAEQHVLLGHDGTHVPW
jgi:NAD(P)-dependent dehydrogenase (short-subunit alcohol dehydrogenase family)